MLVNVSENYLLQYFLQYFNVIGSHCVKPPTPDAIHKLKLQYNPASPPAHGESVMYVCDAGQPHNRFESDFNKWNYSLTCLENNVFTQEPNVPWPTCADSKKQFIINIFTTSCHSHLLPKSYKFGNFRDCA